MKISLWSSKIQVSVMIALACPFFLSYTTAESKELHTDYLVRGDDTSENKIIAAQKINPTTVEIVYANKERLTIDFYSSHIFRMFQDANGILRDPEAKPLAQILVDQPRKEVTSLRVQDISDRVVLYTEDIEFSIHKETSLFKIVNLKTGRTVVESVKPIAFNAKEVSLELREQRNEYFFGGGVQNGRFSHKGKIISIENQNSWTDGGVASPTPYFWSTNGYGFMWYTFKKGKYAFGAKEMGTVKLSHETSYLDVFFMINEGGAPLLRDFYQLTGNPVLLPKFGFYEGHLNAYNRDYWKETEKEFFLRTANVTKRVKQIRQQSENP